MTSTFNKMGCLCFTNGPYISSTNTSKCCCNKAPCHIVVIILLIIEGIVLLTPVFASLSTYNSIDMAMGEAFPDSTTAPDPRRSAFNFGSYLLPGGFAMNGVYTSKHNNVKTFKYKKNAVITITASFLT